MVTTNLSYTIIKFVYLCCVVSLLFVSCNQDLENVGGTSQLTLNVEQEEYSDFATFKSNARSNQQHRVVLDENYFLEVNINTSSNLKFKASPMRRTLGNNVSFRILVFDENYKFLLSRDYVSGSAIVTDIQLLKNKNYSFIVYSFGKTDPIPSLGINVGDPISEAEVILSNYEDVMSYSLLNQLIDQNNNTLSFVLKHVFSKVKTTIDATNAGSIASVGNYSITNTYSQAIVRFTNQSSDPVNLAFSNLNNNLPLVPFSISQDLKSAISSEKLIFADGQQSQTLKLSSLSVNNVQKTNITLLNHIFQPGVYYEIDVKLKSSAEEGYLIGDLYWALGNLVLENGVYKPASNQGEYGDYWLRSDRHLTDGTAGYYYLAPINKSAPQVLGTGSKVKDICNQVGPGWRLPTYLEADALEKFASWYNSPTNKYVGYYTKPNKVDNVYGVYFGTNTRPSYENQDNYLFVPFAGAYNSGVMYDFNSVGFYWHTGMDSGQGTSFQFAPGYMSPRNSGGLDDRRANSVRCVKSK